MNILFITQTAVNPLGGGVQRVTFTLAEEFERMGSRAYFLAIKDTKKSDGPVVDGQLFLPNRRTVVHGDNVRFIESLLVDHDIDVMINQVGIFPEINGLLRRVTRSKAKWINVHHNCVSCLNSRYREIVLGNQGDSKLWKWLDRPLVWSVLKKLNRARYGGYLRDAMRFSDKLVLLSASYVSELSVFGVRRIEERVAVVENPLSFMPPARPGKKHKNIIYVGRLSFTQKRVDKLLAVWRVLHDDFPSWQFDIVGDGEARPWMERFVAEKKLSRISFHGTTDPRPFLERASILTSTSDFEGYPMVLVEAQAYGAIPVCYSSFSAAKDLIADGETGFIVEGLSIERYVHKVKKVMTLVEEGRGETMMEAMRRKVLQVTPDQVAGKWMQLFGELHGTRKSV